MLLRKVIGSILVDLVTAQDLSNEYASQISRKYKQYRNSNENLLNNFEAPASVLKEIEFELAFALTDLYDKAIGFDVEMTWARCQELATEMVDKATDEMQAKLAEFLKSNKLNYWLNERTAASPTDESDLEQSKQSTIQNIKNQWNKVREQLKNEEYMKSVIQIITQKLFKTCKELYLRGNHQISLEEVKKVVEEKLLEGILKHPDIQHSIQYTYDQAEDFYRQAEALPENFKAIKQDIIYTLNDEVKKAFSKVKDNLAESKTRELIQQYAGVVPHAEIMMKPSFLRELPSQSISSLKMTVKMDSYKWSITEQGESLHKAQR
ncbi:MAG: hypothetical protein QNJ42_01775 [Crocosphaera sp.]|nr:hypothetical protein [Crocosphaera sp.]